MSNYSDSQFDETSANTSWYKVFHLIPSDSLVLDVGCSSGNFGKELITRKHCTVDGIELFESDAKIASKKLRTVYELDIERDDLSHIDTRYDVIYFGDVIEHLATPAKSLGRIKSLLKPSGRLVFSVPNMAYIGVRLELLSGNFEYTETGLLDKTHLHFYTMNELEKTLNEAGLEVETLDYVKKDYPKAVLNAELKKSGLTASKRFYEHAAKPELSAFQFVGTARITNTKHARKIRREQFGPVDLFESFYSDTKTNYENRIKELEKENSELSQRLNKIKNHPLYKTASKVKRRLKR